jgi:hypothetical protein
VAGTTVAKATLKKIRHPEQAGLVPALSMDL